MTPSPWAAAYVGLPWEEHVAECWQFACLVWRERFGWEVAPIAAGSDPREVRRLFAEHPERGAWAAVDVPQEGDAVLMRSGSRPSHVGVWVAPSHVLHSVKGSGGLCTPSERLADMGLRVVGFYRRTA